ncbi:MAG: efflux RND transporter permease subunit [Candidatus Azotimanducaceae bacterium WSBS_2022_MAG_OTU7]
MDNYKFLTWFVDNPVTANLMMAVFIAGGSISLSSMHKEEFPNIEPGIVEIQIPYLGAAPEEVEQAVCIRVEEAIEGLEGAEKVSSIAREGLCSVTVALLQNADLTTVLNEIKRKVDAISTFPAETEKPIVSSVQSKGQTISLAVHGDTDEATLRLVAEEIRDDISALTGISQVSVTYARPWEISIEVSEQTLRQYNLTMGQISNAIRRSSLDLPGGSIKTQGGEILLRSKGQAYRGLDFEDIVIVTRPDGTNIELGDIAVVNDSFQEGFLRAKFNGERSVAVAVYRVGQEDTITSADSVKQYLEKKRAQLPQGISLTIWADESIPLNRRINALLVNAYSGLALVLIILTLFLRFKVAAWVAAGIPAAVLGAVWMFPLAGINISSLTVMAFILVLGIIVDDAIVIGERIYSHETTGKSQREAAIAGTAEVFTPVIFGVLTTIAAFLPILVIEGRLGDFFSIIGWVVIACLVFSMLECMLILPAHLAHRKTKGYFLEGKPQIQDWIKFQSKFSGALESFAMNTYKPALEKTLEWRWITWAVATAVLFTSIALVASDRVIFQFFPAVEGDRINATLTMPEGINIEHTEEAALQLELASAETAREVNAALGYDKDKSVITHTFQSIGGGGSHIAGVVLDLVPSKERPGWNTNKIADKWRENTGSITDAIELEFATTTFSGGAPLAVQLKGRDLEQLRQASAYVRTEFARYPGVIDIADSFRAGKQEVKLDILPEAKPLGITLNDLARQVRQSFYGEEAQRIQRGTDDVRVMVRYPKEERQSLGNLENMRVRTRDNIEVPFSTVAKVSYGEGFSSINRVNQQRVIDIRGDIDRSIVTPEEVMAAVEKAVCVSGTSFGSSENSCYNPDYHGVGFKASGEQEQRNKAVRSMLISVPFAMLVIFVLLAIPLKSYMQPLVIMGVIPFGAVGAIVGHYVMGWDLIFFSLLGIIALSGVVVNASLILVDYINRQRREGVPLFDAASNAGVARFRPILLTSVTTFVGLIPLMTDDDPETFMFIPMAISLAFGVLFATAITLFLVPCLYLMLNDWLKFWGLADDSDPALVVHSDPKSSSPINLQ